MLSVYSPLFARLQGTDLAHWGEVMPQQIAQALDINQNGNLAAWSKSVSSLPNLVPRSIDLNTSAIRIGTKEDVDEVQQDLLKQKLKTLHPWRKGPFDIFGIHIDTEWHSDWKWDRVAPHIQNLSGRTVLDVGCGNGYHCWRMAGTGASLVIGIDPTLYSIMQYQAVQHFIQSSDVFVLPVGVDDVPPKLEAFDTVFSMGVLYHRRSPLDHILQLMDSLKPGGELVLETLVIEGDENSVLVPRDRYAQMRNVWFIPSCLMLENWARRCSLRNARIVDATPTSIDEQRATDWMTFQSLRDFLDPSDPGKTVEGYPAPRRAVLIGEKTN